LILEYPQKKGSCFVEDHSLTASRYNDEQLRSSETSEDIMLSPCPCVPSTAVLVAHFVSMRRPLMARVFDL
jgi:hypothetical protein